MAGLAANELVEGVRELVEEFERQYRCREHSLRAYRWDILREPEEWEGQAREFGLKWQHRDGFAVLDDIDPIHIPNMLSDEQNLIYDALSEGIFVEQ